MSWRLDNRRRFVLLCLAVLALLLQMVLDMTRTPTRQRDYDLKLQAAVRAGRAFAAVRQYRGLEGATLDLTNDPAGTGLVGQEVSLITNAAGDLEAKLTTLNPNFAAVLVQYFRQAGLKPGDPVAVAISGSFPGLNICLYSALETIELRPVIITSVGASNWGANSPDFTWLDMEALFFNRGIFHTRSAAATFGGGNDMGRGLSPAGRQLIRQAIERNGVPFLESKNIEDAISQRMSFYEKESRGRPYRLYVNVGGGVASLGSGNNKSLLPTGLSFDLGPHNWPRKGTLILFSEKGVPVVHLLRIISLARANGLPVAPDYLPKPGEGEIFVRGMYRWPLAAVFLVAYGLICLLVLAPEWRRKVLGWLGRKNTTTVSIGAFLVLLVLAPAPSRAAGRWLQVNPRQDHGVVCLRNDNQDFSYLLLDPARPLEFRVNGPRKIKIVSRYLSGPGDPTRQRFSVTVKLDGMELVRKSFRADSNPAMSICAQGDGVSSLRRITLNIPRGNHTVQVTGQSPGSGDVTCRFFKQSNRKTSGSVPFAPEGYLELATLQFDSGKQSTYYRFEKDHPLTFSLNGPAALEVYTRLDFEEGMLGSQKYMLEIFRDGTLWKTLHYDVTRLPSAFYPQQLDLLPGTRKKFRIKVPTGNHHYEIRCARPENRGIAAQIRIPRKDLAGRP